MPESTGPDPINNDPRKNSQQSKVITAYVTAAEIFLDVASTDAEIIPLLAARGYDAAELAEGSTLAATARATLEGRAGGMGNQTQKTAELNAAIEKARDDYAKFREIMRPSFPDKADRLALSLGGTVPEDTGRFITLALSSYGAAGKAPHVTKAAKRGYPATVLDPLIASLNSLTAAAADQDEAQGGAIGNTEARDAAYDALREYMKELKGVARGALRGKHSLLSKLGL